MKEKIVCPECDGRGKVHYSCCGDDVYGTEAEDYDLCPQCREHLPGREGCESCNGTGLIHPLVVSSLKSAFAKRFAAYLTASGQKLNRYDLEL